MAVLEDFPTELKYEILKALPDRQSLQSLIRASKMYFLAYAAMAAEILSQVTLSELATRGVNLHQEASMLELYYTRVLSVENQLKVKDAIIACYKQYLLKQTPKLDIEQCYWLRYLQKILVWRLANTDGKITLECSHPAIMKYRKNTRMGTKPEGCKLLNEYFMYTPREWEQNYPGWSDIAKRDFVFLPIKNDAGVVPLCKHNYCYRKDYMMDMCEGGDVYLVDFIIAIDQ